MRGALARSSSAASGFFFWGMIDEPDVQRVGQRDEAELLAGPQHELGAEPAEVRRAGRRAPTGSRGRSRGWRRRRSSSARRARSRARRRPRRGRCRSSRPPARPRRAAAPRSARRRRRSARGRAAASRRRRAGGGRGRRAARAAGACSRAAASRGGASAASSSAAASASIARVAWPAASRVNSATSVATWSLRERAVCSLPPTGPAISRHAPLDGHVDVLVVVLERERAVGAARPRRRRAPPAARRGRRRR